MSRKNRLEIIARFKNSVAHAYTDGELICSSKNKIYVIKDLNNPRPLVIGKIPWRFFQNMSHVRILDRYLKHSILQVHRTTDRDYLVFNGHSWWHITSQGIVSYVKTFSNTRPMNRGICESKSRITYIAEYISNPDRSTIKVFCSHNLQTFEVAWEFKEKSVRHVHALIVDPELENRIWILTGDLDHESHFYFTDDDFKSVNCFMSAGQKSRATDLIVRNRYIYWGMDSSLETPFILRAPKDSASQVERLYELPGPAYYMTQNEVGGLYLGTTVEPGPALKDMYGRIFGILPDNRWEEMVRCKTDIFPQYGIFYLPKSILPENFIVFAQRALKPYEGYLTIARDNMW